VAIGAESGTRYVVVPPDSWIAFEGSSTLHRVHGKATNLDGYIEAQWAADGTISTEPAPRMHVEFLVEQLRSGNGLQDGEMWKMIDSKRFPRVASDLRELRPTTDPGRYAATGDVTLAGRSRRYNGTLTLSRSGDRITIEGELEIDIRDFGLKPPALLLVKVNPAVKLRLHLAATRSG
jgi:YceI-like protein